MGSWIGGAKAGGLGAAFLAASIGFFNLFLLDVFFRGEVLQALQAYPFCTTGQNTPAGCLLMLLPSSLLEVVIIPVAIFAVVFGGFFGNIFEYIPGIGYRTKALTVALVMLIFMAVFGVSGVVFSSTERTLMTLFDTLAVLAYAMILAHFYRRFTREVEFQSPSDKWKILVDGRDLTKKKKTYALHSTHTVAGPSENGAFKQWLVSGGVSVENPKSVETTMKVEGDGLLKFA